MIELEYQSSHEISWNSHCGLRASLLEKMQAKQCQQISLDVEWKDAKLRTIFQTYQNGFHGSIPSTDKL
jgi:hypothetical protein